jgi:hypothetical protein
MTAPDDDSPQQLALLESEAALDGEVIPPQTGRRMLTQREEEELAEELRQALNEFRASRRQTFDKGVALGEVLLKVKAEVGHGNWMHWVQRRCKFNVGSAAAYMTLARAKQEMPRADFQSLKIRGIHGAATELRRRHREAREIAQWKAERALEQQAKREETAPPIPEPAPERRDHDDLPEQLLLILSRLDDLAARAAAQDIVNLCSDQQVDDLCVLDRVEEFLRRVGDAYVKRVVSRGRGAGIAP